MKRAAKIHFDATRPGWVARAGLCGFIDVETTADKTEVTCEMCKRKLRGPKEAKRRGGLVSQRDLFVEVFAELAPRADAPPVLTAPLWSGTCKGAGVGDQRRCGSCVLCEWEREAEKWAFCAAWNVKAREEHPTSAPAWPSLTAALTALAEWEHHDRVGPSAMGPILERAQRGDVGDGGRSRPDDPLLRRAGELVRVRQALEGAYPEGAHKVLSAADCIRVLMARTIGVLRVSTGPFRGLRSNRVEVPTYEDLSERFGATRGDLRAVVRHGRRSVLVELAARGLVPMPKPAAGLAEAIETVRERFEHAG